MPCCLAGARRLNPATPRTHVLRRSRGIGAGAVMSLKQGLTHIAPHPHNSPPPPPPNAHTCDPRLRPPAPASTPLKYTSRTPPPLLPPARPSGTAAPTCWARRWSWSLART